MYMMQKSRTANFTFDEIAIGDTAHLVRTLTTDDIALFAVVSGDFNPTHINPDNALTDVFHRVVAHGMWGGGLISAVLGTRLPGPGTVYLSQDLQFVAPVEVGDTVTSTVTVLEKLDQGRVVFKCLCTNEAGQALITGTAVVRAPTEKIWHAAVERPDVRLAFHQRHRDLLAKAAGTALPVAVAHPCDEASLRAAVEGAAAGLIEPILVGPSVKIRAAAAVAGLDISAFRLVDEPHSQAAAIRAVALVRLGEAVLLMKGSLHTDELIRAVIARETGLRTARRLSHVYVMDVPSYPRALMLTDAAVNVTPTLEEKRDIVQNAIDLAHVMGIAQPRVAILAAVETVNPAMPSTLDAAALCKMADRGQITGGLLDGPRSEERRVGKEC